MIGYYHRHSLLFSHSDFIVRRNSIITGNNYVNPIIHCSLSIRCSWIPYPSATRSGIYVSARAASLQSFDQNEGRYYPINVIIAYNTDAFFFLYFIPQDLHCLIHIFHQMRRSQFVHLSIKISANFIPVLYIPVSDRLAITGSIPNSFPIAAKSARFAATTHRSMLFPPLMLCRFLSSKQHNNRIVPHNPIWSQVFMPHKNATKNVPTEIILSRYGTFLLSDSFIQISPHYSAVLLSSCCLQGGLQLFTVFLLLWLLRCLAVRMAVLPFSQISRKKSLRMLPQLPVRQRDSFRMFSWCTTEHQ